MDYKLNDVHDPLTRRKNMRAIKSRDTKPEIKLRSLLHRAGYRFRLNQKVGPAKPDLVFAKFSAAFFVNGCFWHGHDCPKFRLPVVRGVFWRDKILANQQRDIAQISALIAGGWNTGVVWECALSGKNKVPGDELVSTISGWFMGDHRWLDVSAFRSTSSSMFDETCSSWKPLS